MVSEPDVRPGVKFGRFSVRKASDDVNLGSCLLLYSQGGSGKTTLAASAADSPPDAPVAFFDAEGGTKVISDRRDVDVIDVKTWKDIKDLEQQCVRTPEQIPWKTIVLDNLSEYIQLATNQIVGNATDQVSQPKWGEMAREVLALVRSFRDLSRMHGLNVVIIAWDSDEKEENGRIKKHLAATPKIQKDLPGIVDIIGWITAIDGQPDKRLITFEPSTRTIAKFRRNRTDAARTIPHQITYGLDDLPLPHIFNALRRGVPFPTVKYPAVQQARQLVTR